MQTPDYARWRPETLTAAAAQQVVLRHHQVVSDGHAHVETQLRSRRWQAPTGRVLVLHNGPLTESQRVWAALLGAPPGSMLHGLTAALAAGLEGFEPDGLSIVVPGSSRSQRRALLDLPDGWNVHVRWSTKLGAQDVNPVAQPPRTRLARSIIDAASERVPERRARILVIAAVQQRLARPDRLWDALSRRGRCRNRAVIAESIVDATGGVESLPEREFSVLCRHLHLPAPRLQQVVVTENGTYCLDTDWPEWGVRSEIHGIPHHDVAHWDRDLARQNDITIEGGGLLIFSSYAIRHDPDRVARQLCRMFARKGWSPGTNNRRLTRPVRLNVGS
jgi:hypothetical protein